MSKTRVRQNVLSFATWRAPRMLLADCITETLCAIDTSKSLRLSILLRYEQYDDAIMLDIDPLHYLTAETFRKDLQVVSLLAKSKFLKTSFDKRAVAEGKFLLAEEQCKDTNRRFLHPDLTDENSRWCESKLTAAARIIAQILGEVPYERVLDDAGWGPGTTTQVKGEWCSFTNKFQSETGCTRDSLPILRKMMPRAYPLWVLKALHPETGSKVSFVPKSAKTDRTIAIEPGLNLWFQRGVGRAIRNRLKRIGVDLNDQSVNQLLARRGSVYGDLATIDFSMASDTVATELVRSLLPSDWFQLMDTFRCKYCEFKGQWVKLEKFSSMGNGFTFELESLIFQVLAQVCSDDDAFVNTYGDDVILPSKSAADFIKLTTYCGFTVNTRKSFSTGYYRESCGAHWFGGEDCKPFFLKDRLSDLPSVMRVHNGLVTRPEYKVATNMLRRCIPRHLQLFGPKSLGDGVLHWYGDLSSRNVRWDREHQCFKVRILRFKPKNASNESFALLLAKVYGLGTAISERLTLELGRESRFEGNVITARGKFSLVSCWVPISHWDQHEHIS